MATFQIHQDAEKENSHMPKLIKEKTLAAAGIKAKSLQPSTVLGGGGAGGIGGLAAKQGRNGNKVAFREVGNVKVHDENVITTAGVAANKKSTVVPVVEQFKTFSVYEDQKALQYSQQQHVIATKTTALLEQNAEIDKENVYEHTRVELKSITNNRRKDEFGIHDEDDYILDTTPMSVSEVLSPMSVDRSQLLSVTGPHLIDDSNSKDLTDAEQQRLNVGPLTEKQQQQHEEQLLKPVARNYRQRFFEVVEYQRSILEYFRESEQKHRPKAQYMRRQNDINYSMRTILVDWLVEVSEEYNLDTETLYLSISYIDRFLSQMSVVRSKLQLVGTAAMYIASKYEEIYPPDVSEFVFITDDTYNKAQVLRMEQIILKILAFDLCTPTAYVFINAYAVLADMSDRLKFLTQYICELSLLEGDPFLRFLPSIISAASLALARHLLGMPMWSPELEDITTYALSDLCEVLLHLCKAHNTAATLAQQAIQEKYKADKYGRVSTITPIELNEAALDAIVRDYNISQTSTNTTTANNSIASSTATTTGTNGCSSNEHVRRMISQMMN